MLRRMFLLLAATAMAVLLAGCGVVQRGDGSSSSQDGSSPPQQEAAGNESTSDGQQQQAEDTNGQHQAECAAARASQRPFVVSYDDDIQTMSLDGSVLTSVTFTESLYGNAVSEYEPAWSPDRKRIAFTRSHYGPASGSATPEAQYSIFVINADSSGKPRRLTAGAGDLNPAWSPDGK